MLTVAHFRGWFFHWIFHIKLRQDINVTVASTNVSASAGVCSS